MNESYKLTPHQTTTFKLNEELAEVAAELREKLQGRWEELNLVEQFFISQFGKAQRTFVSIHTLVRHSLLEDALCLLRVLVENTINLEYGIKSDARRVVGRYFDWAMLDSIRRARATDWFDGTSLYSEERKQNFLNAEATIRARYSSEDFESLKRNVFGISLESRAEIAELSGLYNASYRVLSRNVHAMDIAVTEFARSTSTPDEFNELLEARTSHILDIAQWCLGTLANWVDGQFRCGLNDKLKKLQAHT